MLTDLSCKALIAESKQLKKPLKKADGYGMFLHAFPNGKAYWYHKYAYQGRPRQISYGHYPTISLSEARIKRAESYKLIKDGIDPLQLRKDLTAQIAREADYEFEKVARGWHQRNLHLWSTEHARKVLSRLERNLFPPFGKDPIGKIKRKEFLRVIRMVEKRSPTDAKRLVQDATKIFADAVDEEFADSNIVIGMDKSLTKQKHGHFASMKIDMLPDFLTDLKNNNAGLSQDRLDAIELLMLTVVRPNELVKAEWSEFDFKKSMWIIPKERMKMRDEHFIPLSKQAMALFKKRWDTNFSSSKPSKFVFPSRRKDNIPLAHNTICEIIIDMGYQGKHTGHGFRALFMGIAKEKLKYRHEVPDRQLAHRPRNNVDRAYDRAEFIDERIELMQKYADYIDRQKNEYLNSCPLVFEMSSDKIPLQYMSHQTSVAHYELTIKCRNNVIPAKLPMSLKYNYADG